jgi:hypothetical protein
MYNGGVSSSGTIHKLSWKSVDGMEARTEADRGMKITISACFHSE